MLMHWHARRVHPCKTLAGRSNRTQKRKTEREREEFCTKQKQEERQRVTSRRAGLETDSAGSLRQHKDGGGLGGKAPTLSLPRRRRKSQEFRGRSE